MASKKGSVQNKKSYNKLSYYDKWSIRCMDKTYGSDLWISIENRRLLMSEMLKDFRNLLEELQSENSSNGKKVILRKYPQCKDLLRWALDPYRKFGVSSEMIEKHLLKFGVLHYHPLLLDVLDDLSSGKLSGYEAIGTINTLIVSLGVEYRDTIYRILDKDLKCRTGATLVNSVYPGLIPEFNVALAEDYFKQKDIDLASGEWFWSRKLDGVRCICRKEGDSIRFFSREGHEFFTLGSLKEEILKIGKDNIVLDGEICLVDENGKEDFQNIMKEIRRKNHTIKNPKYMIFDQLTKEEFDSGVGFHSLFTRHLEAVLLFADNKLSPMLELVSQNNIPEGSIEETLLKILDYASSNGWEGIILRKNVGYKGKRSKDLLKVKKFKDAEYEVKEVISGYIDDGQGNKVPGMTAVVIQHKGCRVKVGSGWSHHLRLLYYNHPEEIVGKIITVKYFEETKNQEGGYSLRFPIFKCVHGDKRVL